MGSCCAKGQDTDISLSRKPQTTSDASQLQNTTTAEPAGSPYPGQVQQPGYAQPQQQYAPSQQQSYTQPPQQYAPPQQQYQQQPVQPAYAQPPQQQPVQPAYAQPPQQQPEQPAYAQPQQQYAPPQQQQQNPADYNYYDQSQQPQQQLDANGQPVQPTYQQQEPYTQQPMQPYPDNQYPAAGQAPQGYPAQQPMQPPQQHAPQPIVTESVRPAGVFHDDWSDTFNLSWESGDIDDNNWHFVKEFHTHHLLGMIEDVYLSTTWKGNHNANCKIVLARGEFKHEIFSLNPFGHPSHGYSDATCHVLKTFNQFSGLFRGGDKLLLYYKVGDGEFKLKIKNFHMRLKGRTGTMGANGIIIVAARPAPVVIVEQRRAPMVVVAPRPVIVVAPRPRPVVVIAPRPRPVVVVAPRPRPVVVVAPRPHHTTVVVARGGHHGGGMGRRR